MKGKKALDPEESTFSKLIASVLKQASYEIPRAWEERKKKGRPYRTIKPLGEGGGGREAKDFNIWKDAK